MLRQLASLLNPSEAQAFRTLTKVGGDQVNFIDKNVYMILWYLSLKREWDTLTENFMIGIDRWNWMELVRILKIILVFEVLRKASAFGETLSLWSRSQILIHQIRG